MRKLVIMACTECKSRTYSHFKNKKPTAERLELSKYCPKCRKHVSHKETK